MQCCGKPIRLGGQVQWTLQEPDPDFAQQVLGEPLAKTITHAEEHHGGLPDDAPVTSGTVTAIKAILCRYAAVPGRDDRTRYPVEGSAVVRDVSQADGWEREDGNLRFVSYLVDLNPE